MRWAWFEKPVDLSPGPSLGVPAILGCRSITRQPSAGRTVKRGPERGSTRSRLVLTAAPWQAALMLVRITSILLTLPHLAFAAMSADEFDAYTRGKTLYYSESGRIYGAEEYLDNRRVRWSFLDGSCKDGEWYEAAGRICFIYDDEPGSHCWTFDRSGSGLTARFAGDPDGLELYEAETGGEPILCLGPEVGV